jgi:hypothetical protein
MVLSSCGIPEPVFDERAKHPKLAAISQPGAIGHTVTESSLIDLIHG